MDIGPVELALVVIIIAMLFGVGKLPEVFGAVGKGIREFRREMTPDEKQAAQQKGSTPEQTANIVQLPSSPEATTSVVSETADASETAGGNLKQGVEP